MGAVNFSIDLGLVNELKKVLPLEVFVETGTFRGDTVELVKNAFRQIHTVELSPEYYEVARARFDGQPHIHIVQGDSAIELAKIAPQLYNRSVLYFLDAHWCVAANTAGESSQCPLLDEIRAIGRLNAESLVVIDDARLFLAPPPAPHEISQWPNLNDVLDSLRHLSDAHRVVVLNDNIIFFPHSVSSIVASYGHTHGIDWLAALHKNRDYDNLREQFEGLQNQFDGLLSQLQESRLQFDGLQVQLEERDREIGMLHKVCAEREQLIFHQARALRSHYVWRLLGIVRRAVGTVELAVRRALLPQIGVLRQYPPRPLVIPSQYAASRAQEPLPKISIVTPSYNQAVFLARTIQSVKDQFYENLECIVQDGGSADGSVDVLDRFSSFLTHWQSAKDNGQTHAINLGFAHAHGEIMAYLNSDDVLLPGALHYVADYFSRHPDVDVVYGHRILIDENDQEIGRWVLPPHDDNVLSWADFVPQETLFWRRRVWDRIGGALDESFQFAMDWDLLLRLRDAGAKFVRLPRFIAAFRVHAQQKTSAEIGDVGFREMNRLRERCHGRPVSDHEIRRAVAPYLLRHVLYDKLQRFFPS